MFRSPTLLPSDFLLSPRAELCQQVSDERPLNPSSSAPLSCGTGVVSQAWLPLELLVPLRFNLLKTQTKKKAELGCWAEV